jgi:hypothetical protein
MSAESQGGGGCGVKAAFMLDTGADYIVRLTQCTVGTDPDFGHHKKGDSSDSLGCAVDPGQYQVDDVIGQVVLPQEIKIFDPLIRK